MKKIKLLIIIAVTLVLAIAGVIFNINYTEKDIEKISTGVDVLIDIIGEDNNEFSLETIDVTIEDEEALEEQEIEDEGFELQGEIAYNGITEIPKETVGEYNGLTYFSQIDNRWRNVQFSSIGNINQTIGSSGCGPTCASMVVTSIKGLYTPEQMANLFLKYGYRSANNGTYWSAFRFTADVFDIEYKELVKLDDVCNALNDNWMCIAACGNGLFTTGGHFVLIYGIDGDTLKIYDPYLYNEKFNTATRRGKTVINGNTIYCNKEVFREYANYSRFFCFKNLNIASQDANANLTEEKQEETKVTTRNTAGNYYKLKANCNLWSNSDLTGTRYSYLKNTKIKVLKNINDEVDYIYVPATGRYAYINIAWYNGSSVSNTSSSTKTMTVIAKSGLNIRVGPGTNYKKVGAYSYGTKVTVYSINNGWAKVNNGYMCAQYLK